MSGSTAGLARAAGAGVVAAPGSVAPAADPRTAGGEGGVAPAAGARTSRDERPPRTRLVSLLPALVSLVCGRIAELARAFAPGRGDPDAARTRRLVLRADKLVRWTEKLRKSAARVPSEVSRLAASAEEALKTHLAALAGLACDRIGVLAVSLGALGAPAPGAGSDPDADGSAEARGHAERVRRVVLDIDRMIRWTVRLARLLAGGAGGADGADGADGRAPGARARAAIFPEGIAARLRGARSTLVGLTCEGVDGLGEAFAAEARAEAAAGVDAAAADEAMSRIDRMLRWTDRIEKLLGPAKPLDEAKPHDEAKPRDEAKPAGKAKRVGRATRVGREKPVDRAKPDAGAGPGRTPGTHAPEEAPGGLAADGPTPAGRTSSARRAARRERLRRERRRERRQERRGQRRRAGPLASGSAEARLKAG